MTRMHQSRRHLLKSAAAVSAAVSFAKIGIIPSFAAEGEKKDALTGIDQVLRQATDAKEVPGVVAVAATSDGVLYEGAFGKRDLVKGNDMTLDSVFWIASMTKALTATYATRRAGQTET
jgi:CubicO group peptidase (beta-lactamase class C family)